MRISLAISLCFMPLLASAAMRLDGDHVDVRPKPADETIAVSFSFKNDGNKPVRIVHLESQCSCLSATLDKPTYQPGEKGTGKAEFKVSSFVGEQEKTVTVTTDDPNQSEWIIPFIITVPAVVDIDPRNVQWWVNEAPTPKEMTVKMVGEEPMKLLNITSTRESMEFAFKEIKPGREYKVTLTPKSTADVMIGALKMETDSKIPKFARQLAFFSIVRQPESRKAEATAGPAEVKTAPAPGEEIRRPDPPKKKAAK